MSRATLCALLAGVLAAAAVVDLAQARTPRSRARTRRRRVVRLLLRVGARVGLPRPRHDLDARLAAAGTPLGLTVTDLVALKAGVALVGALVALPFAAAAPGRLGLALLAAGALGGFALPDVWLRRRARDRANAMARELPDVLDLLRVSVEAGLPVGRALGEVGRRHRGTLAGELAATATALELGVPRAGALEALRQRAPLPAVGSFVAAVARSERHGAPLAPSLVALAAQARAERARALSQQAAKAAPKIQLAVALLLVPSVLLLVAAAAVSALVAH